MAAALVDMFDVGNDDNGGDEYRGRNGYADKNAAVPVALATMLRDTMWGSGHRDFLEFWSSLYGELHTIQLAAAREIVFYNWMQGGTETEPTEDTGAAEEESAAGGACAAAQMAAHDAANRDVILQGVRAFRDKGLRTTDEGRELINIFYRNSPEIAVELRGNPELKGLGLSVLTHFAHFGDALGYHGKFEKLRLDGQPIISTNVASAIDKLFSHFDQKGSEELRRDLAVAKAAFAKHRSATLEDLIGAAPKAPAAKKRALAPHAFNPRSKEALKSLR